MALGVGREKHCLMCGFYDYGMKIIQPDDVKRIAATHANRDLRRASTSFSKWGMRHRSVID